MASRENELRVQVCYARPDLQVLKDLIVADGASIADVMARPEIVDMLRGIDTANAKLGIHGKVKAADTRLRDGDRIEIYRPLLADPKEARRKRARQKK